MENRYKFHWTEAEILILRKFPNKPNEAADALEFMGHNRKIDSIYQKMRKLGLVWRTKNTERVRD